MKKLGLLLLVFMITSLQHLGLSLGAQEAPSGPVTQTMQDTQEKIPPGITRNVAQESVKPVHFLITTGTEYRPEKDAQGVSADHMLSNDAIGFGYQSFVFILERAQFTETSGNATLSIERSLSDYLLWTQYRSSSWYRVAPFVGGGIGAYKEKIGTTFSGVLVTNETAPKLLGGISFGLSLDIPVVWLSIETRLLFGDELDRQPILGGVARIGIWF